MAHGSNQSFRIIESERPEFPWPALPKRIEYALKVLICLSQRHQHPVPAHEVARCIRIPSPQAAKILYFLTWAGFVRSRRGPKGGFWLARPPGGISVRQVIKFFRPPAAQDTAASADPLLRVWQQTAALYQRTWAQLTLADLAHRTAENKESLPYICPHTQSVA